MVSANCQINVQYIAKAIPELRWSDIYKHITVMNIRRCMSSCSNKSHSYHHPFFWIREINIALLKSTSGEVGYTHQEKYDSICMFLDNDGDDWKREWRSERAERSPLEFQSTSPTTGTTQPNDVDMSTLASHTEAVPDGSWYREKGAELTWPVAKLLTSEVVYPGWCCISDRLICPQFVSSIYMRK